MSERKGATLFVLAIAFFVGGVLGVVIIRVFFLDPIEEIAWRMFWSGIPNSQPMNLSVVVRSATFAKCMLGFFSLGLVAAFGAYLFGNQTTRNAADTTYFLDDLKR